MRQTKHDGWQHELLWMAHWSGPRAWRTLQMVSLSQLCGRPEGIGEVDRGGELDACVGVLSGLLLPTTPGSHPALLSPLMELSH